MATLNGIPPRFENVIVALDSLGNEKNFFTLEFLQSRLIQMERSSEVRAEKSPKNSNLSVLDNDFWKSTRN